MYILHYFVFTIHYTLYSTYIHDTFIYIIYTLYLSKEAGIHLLVGEHEYCNGSANDLKLNTQCFNDEHLAYIISQNLTQNRLCEMVVVHVALNNGDLHHEHEDYEGDHDHVEEDGGHLLHVTPNDGDLHHDPQDEVWNL